MLEQILAQIMSQLQLIIAALLLAAVILEIIHIRQTQKIHKKISYAGRWLQRYLKVVLSENTDDELQQEDAAKQLEVSQSLKSRQEEDMRMSLIQKKQKKDGELLDSVLEEIFD